MKKNNTDPVLNIYLTEISKYPSLTAEEEIELFEKYKSGDMEARDQLVHANLRFVVKIAYEYSNFGISIMDLISEGNIGLIKAIERFDPSKGNKLITYAIWWIQQTIKKSLANHAKTVRIPVYLINKISKIRNISNKLQHDLQREATDEEIASEIECSAFQVNQMRECGKNSVSLDAPCSNDMNTNFSDILSDENCLSPYENVAQNSLSETIQDILENLTEREFQIINLRFGLNGSKSKTLDESGKELGITRERIRQLQTNILRKIKNQLMDKESLHRVKHNIKFVA